jgi:uncharacterized protein YndB with AHSA1/START domain
MHVGKDVEVIVSLPTDREIAFTGHFQRSAQLLFEAWTRPEHLKRWWGCEGSTITDCAIDLRVGGDWNLVMRMADGSRHPFHGIYLEIVRPRRLVYSECYEMPQYGNPEWLTTVTFDEHQAETVLTHHIQHKSREVRDGHLQSGMQEGTIQVLTRLNEYSAGMQQKTQPKSLQTELT